MRDFDTPNKLSKNSFTYAKFAKLKELAKNSIGESNEVFEIELQTILSLYNEIDYKINLIDKQISTIVKELNPPTLSIPGIGELTTAVIISEFGDFDKFSNADKLLSFAGLEPGIYQSRTMFTNGKMVKRGSGYLRYSLMNIANVVIRYNPTFYDFYLRKRSEGKCHRVALSHVCKKLLRVIYKLETQNIQFNPSLLK
jgi:transposase